MDLIYKKIIKIELVITIAPGINKIATTHHWLTTKISIFDTFLLQF